MPEGRARYGLASAEIVSDVIDGETVLVDLASGSYYTANATGGLIWSLAAAGCSHDEIVAHVGAAWSGDPGAVSAACAAFLERLCAERLLARDGGSVGASGGAPVEPAATPAAAAPFVEPVLTRYTDMEDLLSLDPVHEVDELGWPHVKGADAGPSRNDG